jgi:hypothetical protein
MTGSEDPVMKKYNLYEIKPKTGKHNEEKIHSKNNE